MTSFNMCTIFATMLSYFYSHAFKTVDLYDQCGVAFGLKTVRLEVAAEGLILNWDWRPLRHSCVVSITTQLTDTRICAQFEKLDLANQGLNISVWGKSASAMHDVFLNEYTSDTYIQGSTCVEVGYDMVLFLSGKLSGNPSRFILRVYIDSLPTNVTQYLIIAISLITVCLIPIVVCVLCTRCQVDDDVYDDDSVHTTTTKGTSFYSTSTDEPIFATIGVVS